MMIGIEEILTGLGEAGEMRSLPAGFADPHADFSSNDYLGIAADRYLRKEFLRQLPEDIPFSSSASRLLSAEQESYTRLEDTLSSLYSRPALLFNSGYHLNTGAVSALAKIPSTLVLSDKLSHASIIDGIILSRGKCLRFSHNDIDDLEDKIKKNRDDFRNILIVTESVFSMDGDIAPLEDIVELKKLYPGVSLYLDEAHAFGVFGEKGLGVAEEKNLIPEIDFIAGTLGKAAASSGAFIISSAREKEYLLNKSRSFIFSTAIPPVNAEWSRFVIARMPGMRDKRSHLHDISLKLRNHIEKITGEKNPSESQIIPLMMGSAQKVTAFSRLMAEKGVRALPIRRPTVPPGTERIRFSLGAHHSAGAVDNLINIIDTIL